MGESSGCAALLTITAGMALCLVVAHAQTVDEITDKNIQAHRGLKRLESVETIRQTGTLTIGDFRATFVQENKRPNRVREETTIQGMSEVTAYDAKTGWHVSPFSGRVVGRRCSVRRTQSAQCGSDYLLPEEAAYLRKIEDRGF